MADKDQVKGKMNDLKGNVKEGVGKLTDNERMEHEGQADQLKGKTQDTLGDIKSTVKQAGENIKESIDDATDNDATRRNR